MAGFGCPPRVQFVTASRRTLRELIRHPDVESSEFFNIFDPTPVRVGCFDEQDLEAVLQQMPETRLSAGARTELWGATNGYPILILEVLNALASGGLPGEISPDAMRTGAEQAYAVVRDRLDALWEDCGSSSQDVFRIVNERSSLPRGEVSTGDADVLIDRGFVQLAGNKLQRPNRLLTRLVRELPNDATTMDRLFGSVEPYEANMRGALERRIPHLHNPDPILLKFLIRGLEDLPKHPDILLTHVRAIVNRVFELIWQVEVPGRRIPSDWMDLWEYNNERGIDGWRVSFPQGGRRVRLLELLTGTDKSPKVAKHVSRGTSVLVAAANEIGDFGQHQEGSRVDVGAAYAAVHLCVELANSLCRDLQVE